MVYEQILCWYCCTKGAWIASKIERALLHTRNVGQGLQFAGSAAVDRSEMNDLTSSSGTLNGGSLELNVANPCKLPNGGLEWDGCRQSEVPIKLDWCFMINPSSVWSLGGRCDI